MRVLSSIGWGVAKLALGACWLVMAWAILWAIAVTLEDGLIDAFPAIVVAFVLYLPVHRWHWIVNE